MRGYFGIGMYHPKSGDNVGTLWRSAYQLGASFIFVVGNGVIKPPTFAPSPQDTCKTFRHIPLLVYHSLDEMNVAGATIVCIEQGGTDLFEFEHPERAIYLLGNETSGIPQELLDRHPVVSLPSIRANSYNVSVAGSIVMMERLRQRGR